MKIFEGKTPAERNKTIAAIVLGVMAVFALTYSFGGPFFSRKKTVTVTASPTPTATPSRTAAQQASVLPTDEEINFAYMTTPVIYNPGNFFAPDAGRNIFAFYEPPAPTPFSPTPTPAPTPIIMPPPPPPTPTPPLLIGFVTPQSVYAGSKTFRLEINGNDFTPDSAIYLNGSQLPTTFISPQRLVADVPSNFIAGAGAIQIVVRTPDGRLYSNPVMLNVQAPPTPQFQYIGMIKRQRNNNDTAYFQEQNKPTPLSARLNDVVLGRFRLVSISSEETVFEDVNLGFRHRLALYRPAPGQVAAGQTSVPQNPPGIGPNRIPNRGGDRNPNTPPVPVYVQPGDIQGIPGIPGNVPIYTPPNPPPTPSQKKDVDDEDGGR